jgi:preprotein translocase SecE subunit
VARNRQKAKERQARRKAQKGNGAEAKSAPERRHGGDPIADDVLDELEREGVTDPRIEPPITPPLSASERLRAPDAAEADAEPELGFPDIENDPEHFDPAEDQPEDVEDLAPGPRGHRGKDAEPEREGGSRLVQFLKSVVAELRRVQWPDRQATTTLTGVVLGFVIIAGTYLGLLDALFSRLVDVII